MGPFSACLPGCGLYSHNYSDHTAATKLCIHMSPRISGESNTSNGTVLYRTFLFVKGRCCKTNCHSYFDNKQHFLTLMHRHSSMPDIPSIIHCLYIIYYRWCWLTSTFWKSSLSRMVICLARSSGEYSNSVLRLNNTTKSANKTNW